jgi:ATP-dependent RNA helicase DeaD
MALPFEELGLQEQFVQSVQQMGFTQPTPIQLAAIPVLLAQKDMIGQAQTGSGKTAAYMLPMLQKLQPAEHYVRALVLTPTRELAKQVAEASTQLAGKTSTRILAVYGGQAYAPQTKALSRGVDVVVGTPGRLLDLIARKLLNLSRVDTLVIDEADEMLEMGFIEDVENILKELPEERQIALFSATMPDVIRKLANKYLREPEKISINPQQLTVAETEQRFYHVREENKIVALTRLLEVEQVSSALIFARTKIRAQELADDLIRMGFSADALHGDLNQVRREQVLGKFRQHDITLLVATDVAARGLDIEDVSHVINFDFPQDVENYVHRIGRTGRAGKTGVAITLITPRERFLQNQVVAYTHQKVLDCVAPTVEEVQAHREQRLAERLCDQMVADVNKNERALIEHLGELGLDPTEIAVAAIRLVRSNEAELNHANLAEPVYEPKQKRFEDRKPYNGSKRDGKDSRGDRRGSKNAHVDHPREAGMVRMWMNLGDANGIRPSDVVGAIAAEVGIPGKAIGEIDIRSDHTFVDIAEQHARQVLKESTGKYRLRGQPVTLRLAD